MWTLIRKSSGRTGRKCVGIKKDEGEKLEQEKIEREKEGRKKDERGKAVRKKAEGEKEERKSVISGYRVFGTKYLNNTGSITIELCFVLPIVIGVVMMLIMLMLKAYNEGIALGSGQYMVYQYKESPKLDYGEDIKELEESIMLDRVNGDFEVDQDNICLTIGSLNGGQGQVGDYSIMTVSCKREWKQCADRLRRWQLYGDVLCD